MQLFDDPLAALDAYRGRYPIELEMLDSDGRVAWCATMSEPLQPDQSLLPPTLISEGGPPRFRVRPAGMTLDLEADLAEALRTLAEITEEPEELLVRNALGEYIRRRGLPALVPGEQYIVKLLRQTPGVGATIYETTVRAMSAADAGQIVGDRVRANDIAGMTVTGIPHIPIPEGEQAGIANVTVKWVEG